VKGISVSEVPDHSDAVAFEFTDGKGREELQGMARNTKSRGVDDWYVVPVVPDNWTVRDPVTVWALHLNGVQPEVLAGERADDEDEHTLYARKAVKDAESRHGLRSHPQAVILEMDRSVAELRNLGITFLVIAFAGVNLAWAVAILLPGRSRTLPDHSGGRDPARRRYSGAGVAPERVLKSTFWIGPVPA
jgi:hypothetical protein